MAGDVVPDVGLAPVGQGVEFLAALVVDADEGQLGARIRLVAAQARDPCAAAGQRARQRLQLAHRAAGLAQLDALPHRQFAVAGHELQHLLGLRRPAFDGQPVAGLDARQQRQGLGVQLAGLQRGQGDGQAVAGDEVGDDHVLGAQAGGEDDAPRVPLGRLPQQRQRLRHALLEARPQPGVQADGAQAGTPLFEAGRPRSGGTVW